MIDTKNWKGRKGEKIWKELDVGWCPDLPRSEKCGSEIIYIALKHFWNNFPGTFPKSFFVGMRTEALSPLCKLFIIMLKKI